MPDPLEPGDPERIGEFWLSGRLGAGGQGVVYDAYGPDGARVAVKVLHGAQESPRELKAMAAEARAAQRVASFCTARILLVRLEPPRPYIVSEYIDGLSLQAAVRGSGDRAGRRFAGDDLHRLGIGIATALTAIHRAKVVHRDLKPGNVLLGPDGPRLIDFGIARVLDTRSATPSGFAGTLPYMAPEVYAGGAAGAEADVFAWGAIMVFAATGEHAFRGLNLPEIAHRVRTHEPDLDALPGTLRPLVAAALAKDPMARPAASAVLSALTRDPRDDSGDPADLVAAGAAEAGLHARWEPGDPALGKVAEDAYASLPPGARRLAPELFLRFAVPGEDGSLATRPVPSGELFDRQDAAESQELRHVVETFGSLLLLTGGQFVLTRPALLRAWPRLRGWLEAERDGLRTHHHIRRAARTWAEHGHRRADVLSGAHLDNALHWAASGTRAQSLNRIERGLLDASHRARTAQGRRNRVIAAVLAVTAAVSLLASAWAIRAQRTRSEERAIAASQQLAAQSRQFAGNPGMAALLAAAAQRLHQTPESRAALLDTVTRPGRGALTGYRPNPITVGAGGGRLALGNDDGTVAVWDLKTHEQVGSPRRLLAGARSSNYLHLSVALSPDGRTLAAAGSRGRPPDGTTPLSKVDKGTVRFWDLDTGKPVGDLPVPFPSSVAFAPDGKTVTVIGADGAGLWNVHTRQRIRRTPMPSSFSYPPLTAVISADATTVALGQKGELRIWDLATGQERPSISITAGEVALSPDGRTAATWDGETVRLWNTVTGRELGTRIPQKNRQRLLFTPDGKSLLIGTDMWDVETGVRMGGVSAGTDVVVTEVFAGKETLVTVSSDDSAQTNTVRLWNVRVHQPYPAPLVTAGNRNSPAGPDASLNGRTLAVLSSPAGTDTGYWLWNTGTRARIAGPIDRSPNSLTAATALAAGPDGKALAAGNTYGQIFVWSDDRWIGPFQGGPSATIEAMEFSPDGRYLATGGGSRSETATPVVHGKVQLWDARTGRHIADLGDASQEVSSLAFSPDGRILAAGKGATVRLWDTATHRELGTLDNPSGPVIALAFAPDGKTLATSADRTISLWDVRTGQRRGAPISGHQGKVRSLAFDASGRILASGGDDHTALLWDVTSHRQLGAPLTGHTGAVIALAFDRKSRILTTADTAGTVRRWNIAMPANPTAAACAIAGRSLTPEEWSQHVPSDIPYQNICPEKGRSE